MKKKAIILSSISAIMLCIALAVGLTVSLFTSETAINISVRSGVVQLKAEIADAKLYSVQADPNGTLQDKNGTTYSEVECENGRFLSGGKAEVKEDGSIAIGGVAAGDRVEFTINVENESNIPVMFNTLLKLVDQETNALFDAMRPQVEAKIGDSDFKQGTYDKDNAWRTGWTVIGKDVNDATVKVVLGLPLDADGEIIQGRTAKLQCVMSAVQYTGDRRDMVATIGQNMYPKMADALAAATNGDVIEVYNSDKDFTGKYVIDQSVTITSADGILREMNDVQLEVGDGYSLELSGLKFTGNSSIDLSGASAFTMKNCKAEVAPQRLFDEGAQAYLPRAAFIASTSVRQTGLRLALENNEFAVAESGNGSAAVYLAGAVTGGSSVTGNTFGNKNGAFADYAVELRSVGVASGSEITVANNEFHGAKGVRLAQDTSAFGFKALLSNNKMLAEENDNALLAEASGSASVQLLDSGSTVNGKALALENLSLVGGLMKGVNLTYDVNGLPLGGQVTVYGMTEEVFRASVYASPMASESGLIVMIAE